MKPVDLGKLSIPKGNTVIIPQTGLTLSKNGGTGCRPSGTPRTIRRITWELREILLQKSPVWGCRVTWKDIRTMSITILLLPRLLFIKPETEVFPGKAEAAIPQGLELKQAGCG